MSIKDYISTALAVSLEDAETDSTEYVGAVDYGFDVEHAIETEELYNKVASSVSEIETMDSIATALDNMVKESQGQLLQITDIPVISATLESMGKQIGIEGLSLEGAAENARKVWEHIKDFVKKLIVHVTNFFSSIFGGFVRLKKQAGALKIKAKAYHKEPKGELSNPSYIKELSYKGKVDPSSIITGLTKTATAIDNTFTEVRRSAGFLAQGLANGAYVMLNKEGEFSQNVRLHQATFRSEEFSGGYRIEPFEQHGVSLFYHVVHTPLSAEAGRTIKSASGPEVLSIATDVEKICEVCLEKKFVIDKIKNVYNDILQKTDEAMKKQSSGVLQRAGKLYEPTALVRYGISNYSKTLTDITNVSFKIARAALSYGNHSLA